MGSCTGATYGNDGEHTKGGVDYDRRNLIRGGSVVEYRSTFLLIFTIIDVILFLEKNGTKFLLSLRSLFKQNLFNLL